MTGLGMIGISRFARNDGRCAGGERELFLAAAPPETTIV